MHLSPRVKRIAAIVACLAIPALVAATVYCRRAPIGYFGSWKMIPHDRDDVLHFTTGVVSHETCCGQEQLGTYRQMADGSWVWETPARRRIRATESFELMGVPQLKNPPFTNFSILKPGLLWLTVVSTNQPAKTYRLPRKFFTPKTID
jgi:hypothetical protein